MNPHEHMPSLEEIEAGIKAGQERIARERLRDAFAAAALTGLLSRPQWMPGECVPESYRMADAMLRERVTEPMPKEKRAEVSDSQKPPCVASSWATARQISDAQDYVRDREEFEAWRKSQNNAAPAAGSDGSHSEGSRERASATPAGNTQSHIDVEEVLRELGDVNVGGDVSHTCRTAATVIERLRTWVNELQLSKVEIDALQHVVEDGKIVDMSDYGYLRSLLVRLRPEWEDEPGRSEPINEAAKTNPTPPRNGTPAKGTVPSEGSVPDSRNENEPVAWWLKGCEYDTGCEYEYVSLVKESADAAAAEGGTVTPLYVHPAEPCPYVIGKTTRHCTLTPFTLTDAEREALAGALAAVRVERHASAILQLLKRTESKHD